LLRPEKRPYGVKVRVHVLTAGALGNVEEVCVPLGTGAFLTIAPGRKAPWEGGRKFVITLEGFATAAAAEAAGRRLVQSLLWMAVTLDSPLRLEYTSYEPAAVFERTRSEGMTVEAYGEVSYAPAAVLGELQDAYAKLEDADSKVLLSMEIFCAARLESSQRAVFLTLVSALEPLASPANLGPEVSSFIDECVRALQSNQGVPTGLKNSLVGRLNELRKESIRQALLHLAREALPTNREAERIIDEAYSLRSQIAHTGFPADLDVDLEREGRAVSAVIREIYASLLKQKLTRQSAG